MFDSSEPSLIDLNCVIVLLFEGIGRAINPSWPSDRFSDCITSAMSSPMNLFRDGLGDSSLGCFGMLGKYVFGD